MVEPRPLPDRLSENQESPERGHAGESILVAFDQEHTRQASAGIARYARSLISALRKRNDISVVELGGGGVVPRDTLGKRALTVRQDFLWYPWLGRRQAARAGAAIYHVPIPRGPLTRGAPPFVVTVHDLVPLLFPETMTPWSRIYSRLTLRRILQAADIIITPSKNTADDLESLLGLPAERIRPVYNGVDELFFAPPARDQTGTQNTMPSDLQSDIVRGAIGGDPYVLFVGTPEPRKNLKRLIAAVALARGRGLRERLIIAGAGGWGVTGIAGPHVQVLGRVSDTDLRRLYAGASCVALPSLHEGFGLPAVEAMAAGTPVVAARAGALPEITAGAAVLVNPLDVDDIAEGIVRAVCDRASLAEAGRERAKHFTWERAAAGTANVYRELI